MLTTQAAAVLPQGLSARLTELFPGFNVVRAKVLGADEHPEGESAKELGYGQPIKITLSNGIVEKRMVFHVAAANDFGHDRRSDRAQNMLLSYDTFALIPNHSRALDVGAVCDDGTLVSVRDAGEFYLLTEWVSGSLYADDLRRIGASGECTEVDLAKAKSLASYLATLHQMPGSHPAAYTRSIRDLLGHGEGIFGLVDSYDESMGIDLGQLKRIEEKCLEWRWRLKGQVSRLRRIHGDFHPFNIVFSQQGVPQLLDTSRGSEGDPADDVACISINYLFFALEHRERFASGLGKLWGAFWDHYLSQNSESVLNALGPFFAWRALVLASPLWYPHLTQQDRQRIFTFVERVLDSPRFEPTWGLQAMQ